jgi:hypothetical protein
MLRCRSGLRGFRLCRVLALTLSAVVGLAGCRLYEPPRYTRLAFKPGQAQTRVLMIGDSLTYYNDLPGLLQQFSAREAAPIYIEQITFPLASLSFHWDGGKAVDRIRNGNFNYVILQDFSRRPVTDPEGSMRDFSRFDEEIRRSGARTIIFQNWTRRDLEEEYPALVKTYAAIVEKTHATLAPIGAAWKDVAANRPDVKLLLDDRHPTDEGSYLTACVIYDTLYGKPSAGLPLDLPGPKLSASVMEALRSAADHAARGP